jgi:hypothetical protein
MNVRLATLVKRVAELCEAGLKACHCIKEFYLWWIHPLGRRDKSTYECPRMVDPNHEPTKGKLSILYFKYWCYNYPDLTFLLPCIVLSQEEADWLMGQLFDKDLPIAWPADLPLPYSSKNPHPSVRATVFSDHPSTYD